MSTLYLSQHEITAIKAIDVREVERRVEQALDGACATALYDLHLSSCGLHIAYQLHKYERDLMNYAKAKAATKRAETRSRAWISGHDLIYVVRDMQQRVGEQEKETELLRIDDIIAPPYRFRDRIEVHVHYQWRRTVEDPWTFGTITFVHDVDMRPDYTLPQPKRKLSAAKQEEQRQETLYGRWEQLRRLALHAVREFLKSGGDGSRMPETFEAKPAARDRYLNNFSCDFWRGQESKTSLNRRRHLPYGESGL